MTTLKKITDLTGWRLFFSVLLSVWATNSFALAIGELESITEPEPEYESKALKDSRQLIQLGLGSNLNFVSTNQDIGNTERLYSAQALNVYMNGWLRNDIRFLADLYTSKYGFTASENYIGQEVNQQGIRLSLQKELAIVGKLKPWFGGGVEFSSSSYRKRHEVDREGFLTNQFPDQSNIGVGILLNAMQKWQISSDMMVAAKLEYNLPVSRSVSRISFGLILFFDFDLEDSDFKI